MTIDVKTQATGLRTATRILEQWGATAPQVEAILSGPAQLERISHVLAMHITLRLLFDNPENVERFMRMINHNPGFYGWAPLDLIAQGELESLREVRARIDAIVLR